MQIIFYLNQILLIFSDIGKCKISNMKFNGAIKCSFFINAMLYVVRSKQVFIGHFCYQVYFSYRYGYICQRLFRMLYFNRISRNKILNNLKC